MSEVGHLIINGSIYVVLCHVFFAGESLDYLIFVGGGSNLMQLYGDFLKRVKIHAVFWVVNKSIDPLFWFTTTTTTCKLMMDTGCGHDHLCIPTSEVTSRMKREPARASRTIQDLGGFFLSTFFGCHRKPIPSMYDIFTYVWLKCMVNVGKYTIHGSYGKGMVSNVCELTPFSSKSQASYEGYAIWSSFHKFPSDF